MRKKYDMIRFITLMLCTGIFCGCSDFFQPENNDSVKEDDFANSREDLNASALGIYSILSQEVHKFLLWGSARADLVTVGEEGADAYITEFVNNNVTELNPYTNYAGLYKAIARCNRQIENIAKVAKVDFSLDDNAISAYYGEAYYLRALCYFYLVRTFKEFPIITEDLTEEIIQVTENGDTIHLKTLELTEEEIRSIALQPASEQKAWELIYSDAKKAMGMLRMDFKWNGSSLSNEEKYGRANLSAAYALACDVAMWMGEFVKASAYADLIIKNSGYDVTSPNTWGNCFTATFAAGHTINLLGYNFNQSQETNRLQEFTSPVAKDGGKYLLKPVKDIVDSLFIESGDPRAAYTFKRINKQDIIWKYIAKNGETAMRDPYKSVASWHLYRSADIYLLKGMAENRRENSGGAIYFLNFVRSNRGLSQFDKTKIDMSMENLENLLLAERAREFAFEGKRWYDLLLVAKQFGRKDIIPATVSKKYPKAERAAMYTWLSDENNWYLPIDPKRWE